MRVTIVILGAMAAITMALPQSPNKPTEDLESLVKRVRDVPLRSPKLLEPK
jgi:hypothetical protein